MIGNALKSLKPTNEESMADQVGKIKFRTTILQARKTATGSADSCWMTVDRSLAVIYFATSFK
ncbi:hypothetical protein SAE01_16010 [Segetibacter aerophilus]|uniref:Uncharacterized protein n=1 Tax=Segetibacter aerophilus TaxID=670293 RepID=A0A512BB42_9BACT|nr:hypothetical protein SAE01_16010 [Segetibacter aerophilus]